MDSSQAEGETGGDSDMDFEDCEESDGDDEKPPEVIDVDASQQACLEMIGTFFEHVLQRTQPIPQVIGLARHAEDGLDEV